MFLFAQGVDGVLWHKRRLEIRSRLCSSLLYEFDLRSATLLAVNSFIYLSLP